MLKALIQKCKIELIFSFIFIAMAINIKVVLLNKIFNLPIFLFMLSQGLIMLIIAYLRYYEKTKLIKNADITVALILIFFVINFHLVIGLALANFLTPNTDYSNYKGYSYSELDFFPKEIPSNAEDINFLEQETFLQGGAVKLLKYKTDSEEIEEVINKYKDNCKLYLTGDNYNSYEYENYDEQQYYIPVYYADDFGTDVNFEVNENYDVIILYSEKYSGAGYWNHGVSYGIFINKKDNIIIYWYENW